MNYKDIKIEDIIDYCTKHNKVDWLKQVAAQTYKTKNGKEGRLLLTDRD